VLLTELYALRAEAFTTAATAPLTGVYTPGSDRLAADLQFTGELSGAGRRLRGFAHAVVRVTAASVSGDRAVVDLVDSWPGYDVVPATDPDGPVVRTDPGRPETPVRMVLRRTDDGWRIESAQLLP